MENKKVKKKKQGKSSLNSGCNTGQGEWRLAGQLLAVAQRTRGSEWLEQGGGDFDEKLGGWGRPCWASQSNSIIAYTVY